MLMPAPIEAASPTTNASQLLCVESAAANTGASVGQQSDDEAGVVHSVPSGGILYMRHADARDESMTGTFWNSTVESARRRCRPRMLPMRAQRALSPDGNQNAVHRAGTFLSSSGERLERTDER